MDPSSLPQPQDAPLPPPAPPSQPSAPPPPTSAATIANPTPPTLNLNNHPPYSEMIYEAITALKEKGGSSKRAIAKYIEKAYANLPSTHSALLTHHLKRLKNSGFLVMVKKSYQLPRSDATFPPNDVVNNSTTTTTTTTVSAAHGPKAGRKRGRPRKSTTGSALVVDKSKRGPGRPRKSEVPVQLGPKKRMPGRPRKPKTVKGRPVQVPVQSQDQLNPVTVSYVTTDANVHVPVPVPGGARPRGRPRKVGTSGDAGGKQQRGRPPKKLKNSTGSGRPVGRPKKEKSEAQAVADLRRKLEFFQSKVNQALSILKPQLNSGNHISVVAAIQELEGLASMDVNAPLREDPQPQAQPQPQQQPQPQPPVVLS
ncbi:HMG-Y-related protein A [Melia azedarach]|uniref:HMG-Y-related protein A n=1 Tax=Melia azedarach TaxID=155640 RepID=A0ACC1XPX5_MELAZ|nr:HMG-Y-related protein A [Melia azedarach]